MLVSACGKVSQVYMHIYPLFFRFFSHIGHYRVLSRVPYALQLFSRSVMSDSLWPHGLQHAKLPCPSPAPRVCSNSCPLSQWCHPSISSFVLIFSCLQSFPASGSFPVSWLFTSGGQNFGASASTSVLPMNIQGWFPLGLTCMLSLLFQGLSRVFLLALSFI